MKTMRNPSRYIVLLVQLVISLGFIYLLVRKADLGEIRANLMVASLPILACSLLTKCCGFSFLFTRLHFLTRPAGALPIRDAFRAQAIAFTGNNVLPLRLGEGLKVGYMATKGNYSFTSCIGIAAVERVLDAVFLVLVFGASILFFSEWIPTGGALFAFVGVACSAFSKHSNAARKPDRFVSMVSFATRILGEGPSRLLGQHATTFAQGLQPLASARLLLLLFLFTAGYWLFSALSVYIWILAFGIDVPWYAALIVLVFLSLATMIPAAPGYVGTYHYFAAFALGLFGVSAGLAASFAIVGHAVAIIPFTLAFTPLVAKDIIVLHREGIPKLVGAAKQMGNEFAAAKRDRKCGQVELSGVSAESE